MRSRKSPLARAINFAFARQNSFFITVSKTRSFLKYWLVPLAWMSLIFVGSSDSKSYTHSSRIIEPLLHWLFPHMPQAHIEAIHHVFRKCCHLTEYAILATLLWRAVRKPIRRDPRPWSWREATIAVLSDVFIDTSGAIIGMIVLCLLGRCFNWWPRTKMSKAEKSS
jgi:VanZ family protein